MRIHSYENGQSFFGRSWVRRARPPSKCGVKNQAQTLPCFIFAYAISTLRQVLPEKRGATGYLAADPSGPAFLHHEGVQTL